MGLLQKIGKIVAQGVAIVAGFGPILANLKPGSAGAIQVVSQDLAQIADIVTLMETVFQTPGSGVLKLQGATPAVAQIILKSSLLANHQIERPALFQQGCQELASGMADILNSLHDKDVQVESKAA